jgi:hypothetical protein
MPGGVGGVAPRGVPLSRSSTQSGRSFGRIGRALSAPKATLLRYDLSVSARIKRSLENRALAPRAFGAQAGRQAHIHAEDSGGYGRHHRSRPHYRRDWNAGALLGTARRSRRQAKNALHYADIGINTYLQVTRHEPRQSQIGAFPTDPSRRQGPISVVLQWPSSFRPASACLISEPPVGSTDHALHFVRKRSQ